MEGTDVVVDTNFRFSNLEENSMLGTINDELSCPPEDWKAKFSKLKLKTWDRVGTEECTEDAKLDTKLELDA